MKNFISSIFIGLSVLLAINLSAQNNALNFNGSNQYVSIGTFPAFTEYTVEMWVKPSATGARSIMTLTQTNTFSLYSHQLRINANNKFEHYTYDQSSGPKTITGTTTISANTWYHVAISAKNGGVVSLHVNGVSEGTPLSCVTLWNTGYTFRLAQGSGAAAAYFNGEIDELRIWNKERTTTEINTNKNVSYTTNQTNLIGNFLFNGNTTNTQSNSSITAAAFNSPNYVTSTASPKLSSSITSHYNAYCNGTASGSLTVAATSGSPNYSYTWSNGSTTNNSSLATNSIYSLAAGTYTVTIIDANFDTTYSSAVIEQPAAYINQALTTNKSSYLPGESAAITTASSEKGVKYSLYSTAGSYITGPKDGTGSSLTFITGAVNSTTDYYLYASRDTALSTISGFSLSLDGVDDHINCGNSASFNMTSAFSLEAWVYPTAFKANVWDGSIIEKTTGNFDGYMLRTGDNGKMDFYIGSGGSWKGITTSANALSLNSWQHVAASYDGSLLKIYVDGVLVQSGPATGSVTSNSSNFMIGSSAAFPTRSFEGKIDEVRIWNDTRTLTEISENQLSWLSGSEPNLISLYRFQATSGVSAYDNVSGNTGTLTNFNTSTAWSTGLGQNSDCSSFLYNDTVSVSVGSANPANLVITEIMYNPPESGTDSTEYIEIYNNDSVAVNLNDYSFSQGIVYTLPNITLDTGNYLLLSVDSMGFYNRYGKSAYQWTSSSLANGGEGIVLKDNLNRTVDSVDYDDGAPWPTSANGSVWANGGGTSLVLCNPDSNNANGSNWALCTDSVSTPFVNGRRIYGSPGTGDNSCASFNATLIQQNKTSCDTSVGTGSITVALEGGFKPYSFNMYNLDYSFSSFQNPSLDTFTVSGLKKGDYWCITTDYTGAPDTLFISISDNSNNLTANVSSGASLKCAGDTNGMLISGKSGGAAPYTYQWSNGATSDSLFNAGAGTYTVTVTDSNMCTVSDTYNLTEPTALSTSISVTSSYNGEQITCNGASDGEATASATGGTPGYTFLWSNSSTNATATGLSVGAATITVTDANGCTAIDTVTLTQPPVLIASSLDSNVSCNGFSDGSFTGSYSGGVGAPTYLWSNGATTASITGIAAGTYTLTITDQNGCTATIMDTVNEPTALVASASVTSYFNSANISCNGSSDGEAMASATGGTGSYTYAWNNGVTIANISSLSANSYYVTVTDANGCYDSASVTLTQPSAITVSASQDSAASCPTASNGVASVSASGGTGNFTYAWSNSATASIINGLAPATYMVTVSDTNNCSNTDSVTITSNSTLAASASVNSNVSCNGLSNGTAMVSATGGATPFSYSWTNGDTSASLSNVAAGIYYVTVTDGNGCSDSASVSITEPTLMVASATVTSNYNGEHITCSGYADGEATASATGGTAGYTFGWSNGGTSAILTGLSAGDYTITITDANNCSVVDTVTLTEPPALSATSALDSNVSCNGGSDGSLTAGYSGGVGAPTYMWSNGNNTASATGLVAGFYNVTVTDQNGCVASIADTVNEPSVLNVSVSQYSSYHGEPIKCFGDSNGAAQVTAFGGTSGYTYLWSSGASTTIAGNIPAGTYTVTVTDSKGCTAIDSIILSQPSALVASTVVDSLASCSTAPNGGATASALGGTGSKTFNWSNSTGNASITGVIPGTYSVIVSDLNGCMDTSAVTIGSNSTLSAIASVTNNVSCFGGSDAGASVTATGGAMPFSYTWSNSNTDSTQSGLIAGTYYVTVTDGNGCSDSASVIITEPTALVASARVTSNYNGEHISCNGSSDGEATASAAGGTPGYTYLWSNSSTNTTASGLSAGKASVTITDANGCVDTSSVTLTEPVLLVTTSTLDSNVSCNGNADGGLSANISGGTGTYSYSWSNGANTSSITGLLAGIYSVTISDANGCSTSVSDTVTEPNSLVVISAVDSNATCSGFANGGTSVTPSGGTSPYTYAWSNSLTTASITGVIAGTYFVTVTDANGCSSSSSTTITEPTAVMASSSLIADASCPTAINGSALASGSGGTSPFTYSWSDNSSNDTLSGVMPGTYSVTVSDANGCMDTSSVSVGSNSTLSAVASVTNNVSCFGGSDASATIAATGGAAPFSYLWSNNDTTTTLSGLNAGNYYVTVTDGNGCFDSASVTITEPIALSASTVINTNILCYGEATGGATASGSGGTVSYSYAWSNSATSAAITGVSYGAYTVTVTDANNCTDTSSVVITQPISGVNLSTAVIYDVNCFGENNGSAAASAFGGSGTLSYSWSNNSNSDTISNLNAGTYYVTVSDSNNCSISDSVIISQPNSALSVTIDSVNHIACFGDSTGEVFSTAIGGTAPYSYAWSNGDTTPDIFNIPTGALYFTTTDAKNCTYIDSIYIIQQPLLIATTVVDSNVLCYGDTTGKASVSASGGTGSYSFSWSNSQTKNSINNLNAGTYKVTVTDANNCTDTNSAIIIQPASGISTSFTTSNVLCNGGSSGSALVSAAGGTPNYTYSWSNSSSNDTLYNIPADTYSVTITDANGCTKTDSVTINEPIGLVASAVLDSNASCNGFTNGGASTAVLGGTSPYSYSWSNSDTTSAIENVSAGMYSIVITDANGCPASDTVTISEPNVLVASSVLLSDASCPTASNGSALASANGGTGSFSYSWSNNSSNDSLSGVMPGTYSVTVTDGNGCFDTSSVSIGSNSTLSASATVDNHVSCFGGSNGEASALAIGGSNPFSYAWSNNDTTAGVTGLSSGNYTVTITDGNTCSDTASVNILEPTLILSSTVVDSNASCNGLTDGGASVTASGGTGTITFLWSNGDTTSTIVGLGAATYYVTATDSNSCSVIDSVTITEPNLLTTSVTLNSNVLCNGDSTGSATVSATGGTTNYSFMWSNSSTNATLSNVPSGSYQVNVTDANGCSALDTITISEPTLLSLSTATDSNVSCNSGSNGGGTAMLMGGVLPYSYSWSNSDTTASITGLMAGNYLLTVTDSNSCSLVDSVVITEPTAVVLTTTIDSNVKCFGTFTGGAMAMATGGLGTFKYLWSNGDTTAFMTGVKAGNYTVTVTDSLNCIATSGVGISQNAPIGARLGSVYHPECNSDSTGFINVFTGAGIAPLRYIWNNGDTNRNISNLPKGFYAITITDANGCVDSLSTTIIAVDTIKPVINTMPFMVYLDNSGNASVTADDLNNGTSDNCGIETISIDRTSFTCADIGNNTINFTATDTSNNSSTQSVVVTVVNNIMPTFSTFPSDTVICKADSSSLWYPASVLPGTDNCGNLASIKQVEGPVSPSYLPGVTRVGWEVSDRYGNKDTAYYTITINVVPNWGNFIMGDVGPEVCNVSSLTFYTDTSLTKVDWYWTFRGAPTLNTDTTDTVSISTPTNDDILNLGIIVENKYGCTDSSGVEITYSAACASVDELLNNATINYYPNPNQGEFTMNTSGLKGNVTLRVTDVHGKLIETFNWENGELLQNINLELHDVESGMYILKLEEARGISVHRITLNR